MIRVTVLYPNTEGSKFDLKYYIEKHMALVKAPTGSARPGPD